MNRIGRSLSASALAVSGIGMAHAQTPQQQDALEEIIVTARTLEETLAVELSRYGHDVEMVTSDRINAAGYLDVSTALQYEVPGLFVSPGSGPFDYVDVSLQGSRTGDVLWLIDGIRINNRIFNSTSPDTMPAGMVERIEVLKGGESLFYGTQGVAGAVNIVTRSFSDEPGGQVSAGLDSNNGYRVSGYGRGPVGNHNLVLYGSKDEGDGFEQYDEYQPSATDLDRGYDVTNVGAKYGYDLTDKARIDVLYHHTDAVLENNAAARTKDSYNDRDEDVISVKLAYEVSDSVELLVKTYRHDWDTTYANIQNNPATGKEVVIYPPGTYWGFRDYGANALVKIAPGGAAEYHVGYDYQNYTARDDVFPIAGETETVNAAFVQVRSAEGTFENLDVAAGARYNRGSGGKDATVWNVSSRYSILNDDRLFLQGMAASAFLLPSAEQLYYVGFPPDDYVGNPDLEPEESVNVNLTIGGRFPVGSGAFGWQLTGFARDIDNLIDIDFDNPVYPSGRYENLAGKVTVRGAEAAVAASFGNGFNVDLSYTHTESRMQGSDQQLARTPVSFTKAGFKYVKPGGRYEASATLNWLGDVYQSVGGFGRNNIGEYSVLNLAARFSVDEAGRHRIGLGILNAFDEEYATRLAQVQRDDGAGPTLVQRLGVPRTVNFTYTVEF